jgi:hypothetical protein
MGCLPFRGSLVTRQSSRGDSVEQGRFRKSQSTCLTAVTSTSQSDRAPSPSDKIMQGLIKSGQIERIYM